MPDVFRLRNILQTMAENRPVPGCAVEVALVESFANAPLFPIEISVIASAAPPRMATFRAGRACARGALKELGSRNVAIPIGPSGAPIWPPGFVGSITH